MIVALGAKPPAPLSASADSQATADSLFLKRDRLANAVAALAIYEKLAASPAANPEILWRAAMAHYFVTQRSPELTSALREAGYESGLAFGRRALEHTAADCAPCNFWTAVNLALLSELRGPFRALRTLKEVRALLAKTAEIDPAYAAGGAHRILGMIETRLPRLIGGDPYEARRYFKAAIATAPDEPMNYLALAKLEAGHFENSQEALALVERGLAQPMPSPDRAESRDARLELTQLMPTLKN